MATEENPTVTDHAPVEPVPTAVVDELTVDTEDGSHHGSGCTHDLLSPEAEAVLDLRESARLEGMAPHEQVAFLGFTVDSGLRAIVENLWVMGMPTDFSCQGDLELCHPEIPNGEYHGQIVFIRAQDAIRFLGMLLENFGAGTDYGMEGFELATMDGDIETLYEWGYDETHPNFREWVNARTRGEVRFHPAYLPQIEAILEQKVVDSSDYLQKRIGVRSSSDLEYIYEQVLDVSPEFQEIAEKSCDCC